MRATSTTGEKARVGDEFPTLELTASSGQLVTIPHPAGGFVHLQLRHFVGCPICNLHLRSIQRLGVEHRPSSLLSTRALGAAIAGQAAALMKRSTMRALGPVKPTWGVLGLPADFLIAPGGRLAALKDGQHAYDQWTIDKRLDYAQPSPRTAGALV